ncbi:hypothetical protein E2562_033384 [Oryza meyeriana var. granulata]|uniref:Uncharacterized protein n=1 Tax=Oryza meyeriana var. granulata TaxID=110450 RepID=A0A6G1C1X3_9ORYZ|nr:hypothetical protein E2562_033384 [Oryza meyeriana var. granulata]
MSTIPHQSDNHNTGSHYQRKPQHRQHCQMRHIEELGAFLKLPDTSSPPSRTADPKAAACTYAFRSRSAALEIGGGAGVMEESGLDRATAAVTLAAGAGGGDLRRQAQGEGESGNQAAGAGAQEGGRHHRAKGAAAVGAEAASGMEAPRTFAPHRRLAVRETRVR